MRSVAGVLGSLNRSGEPVSVWIPSTEECVRSSKRLADANVTAHSGYIPLGCSGRGGA